ncbi:MAG: hypothetical protein CL878_09990 [Dehalococcoidia bacterium]|nr:hypothetical protein [Dehalococcoidia bacterium]
MKTLVRLLQFVRPYWLATVAVIVLILAMTLFRMAPAFLTKLVIDDAIGQSDMGLALRYVLLLVAAAILTNGITAIQTYLEQFVGQRVIYDLRNVVYQHVQSQSMSFFDTNQSGQLMSRVTNDVGQVQFFLTQGLSRLLTTAAMIAFHLVALFAFDVPLTLVALIVTPVVVYFQRRMGGLMSAYRGMMEKMAELNVVIQENVAGVKLVKAYGREPHEADRFNEVNQAIREQRLTVSRRMAFVMPGQEFAGQLSTIIVLVVGASRVMSGSMTIGDLVAFNALLLTMWMPMRFIGFINQMGQQAVAAGERIFDILDTDFEVVEKPDAVELERLAGRVEVRNVAFAYGNSPPLLSEVDFALEPGGTLALVGASGSGKSTLINLIPRFYDVSDGAVLIDGHDVRDLQLKSLRSQIGMVMQESFLFNSTVRANICYGRDEASIGEMEEAARAANAHEFIAELPKGYDTLVGEHGVRLSGGQRQRLAIARALLVDPRILILDEATSSVDTQTDYMIQRALDELMVGRTTIVIAHRLSTVQRADMILVLDDGRIVGRGAHAELLETSVHYRRIHDLQFRLQYEGAGVSSGNGNEAQPPPGHNGADGTGSQRGRAAGNGADKELPR